MIERDGKAVCQGIAIGRIHYYTKEVPAVVRAKTEDTEQEWQRYENAKRRTIDQLESLYQKAVKEVGNDNAEIFHVHAMMLEDEDYNNSIRNIIETQQVNAEYAVAVTGDNFAELFAGMEDEYFKARSADVKDISERIIRNLSEEGKQQGEDSLQNASDRSGGIYERNHINPYDMRENVADSSEPSVIIIADDLVPSETVQFDKSKVCAFVTKHGSANSHTAILARTMAIPALVGTDISNEFDGKMGIVDGYEGRLIIDPDTPVLAEYFEKKREEENKKSLLKQMKGKETVTKSGKRIKLYANIGNPGDLINVLENDADGIGLFRSEFLYLESEDYPTEEQQFQAYKKVVETMGGKQVIIRTLDIGADKQAEYFQLKPEENPAMGMRAIRICLTRPELFRTQLRAIYRASAYGKLAVMYPMITSVWEVKKIREISKSVREELRAEGFDIGEVEEGLMIETPAAAIISDELAELADFFSIGTNDLTQYTLAIDRQNAELEEFFDPRHPALLRLIRNVIDNAHKAGIWVGICGELAADTTLTGEFIRMGIDELSVSPRNIFDVRKVIRETK